MEDNDWGSSDFPLVVTKIVRDRLYQVNIFKSMGSGAIHPRVLRQLEDVISGPLSTTYQWSWKFSVGCRM